MVSKGHSYRLCSLCELSSNHAVKLCGRGIPTDMVMYCDNVSCIVEHPESHDIPRVGSVFRHTSPRQILTLLSNSCFGLRNNAQNSSTSRSSSCGIMWSPMAKAFFRTGFSSGAVFLNRFPNSQAATIAMARFLPMPR